MKRHSAQWKTANSPRPKKFSRSKLRVKTIFLTFFLILEGLFIINLFQLDKQSAKFTIWKYWKGCVKKIRWKRPELFANNSWNLHHDNTPAHTALSVREILATKQITVLENPACSPDLAPGDFLCSRR